MKKNFLILFFTCFILHAAFSQNPLVKQWDKRFGGTSIDYFSSFQQTADGGYILGGISYSDSSGDKTQASWGNWDYWIIKIDSLGSKQWDKDFGGIDEDELYSVKHTADGGYIIGGSSQSGTSGDKTQNTWGGWDYWIVKTDSFGNKQWDKDFGGTDDDVLLSIEQTNDGGYILGGISLSGISGDKTQPNWDTISPISPDYWIIKTDASGNKQWDMDFGGTDGDYLYSLQQTVDGGYILGGYSSSGISGDKTQATWGSSDYWIVKTNSLGNKQWDRDFGGTNSDYLFMLQQTVNGGYILGGSSYSDSSGDKTQDTWGITGDSDYWIVKIDSLGIKQWDKDFGGAEGEEFYNILQVSDNGYLLSGDSYSPISGDKTENNLGMEQTWVVKTDSFGNYQWDKTIFTTGHDEKGQALQTQDGCYAFANYTSAGIGGYKTQLGWGSEDYWIIKFCDSTLTTSVTQLPNTQLSFSIFPNPADEFMVISSELGVEKIEIINILGGIVSIYDFPKNQNAFTIDIKNFPQGIYFVKLKTGGFEEVKKVVKY